MAKNNETTVDSDPLGEVDRYLLDTIWNWAKPKKSLTTSEQIESISPETAEKYRKNREVHDAVMKIKAMEEARAEREAKNDPWKFVRNVAKFVVGEIDKSDKR